MHQQNVTNAFWRTFSFGKCSASHFPKENVQQRCAKMHLMRCKNAFLHQMHLMQKCILAYIFQRKMFSCAKMHLMQKCIFATHHIFQRKMFSCAKMHLMRCKNAFVTFCYTKCTHQMHLMPKCILAYIFQRKMFSITFSKGKCSAPTKCTQRTASNTFLHQAVLAKHCKD